MCRKMVKNIKEYNEEKRQCHIMEKVLKRVYEIVRCRMVVTRNSQMDIPALAQ